MQAGLLSREIRCFAGADAVGKAEGNIAASVMRELAGDPARSEIHGMYGTFMRENRESPVPPVRVVCGRAVQGTLRR